MLLPIELLLLCHIGVVPACLPACLQLVEALNEDYSDYVGLSGQLSGLEGAVVRMRQPLLEIQVRRRHAAAKVLLHRGMLGSVHSCFSALPVYRVCLALPERRPELQLPA